MELGGVGRPPVGFRAGRNLAATAAKLSLPAQKSSRGFGISTDSVIPAKAKEMLELVALVGAMSLRLMFVSSGLDGACMSQLGIDPALRNK